MATKPQTIRPSEGRSQKSSRRPIGTASFVLLALVLLVSCAASAAMGATPERYRLGIALTSRPEPTLTFTPPPLPTVHVSAVSNPPRTTATPSAVQNLWGSPAPSDVPTRTAAFAPTLLPTHTATASPTATPVSSPTPTFHPNPSPVATTAFSQDIIHILLIGGDKDYALDMNTDTLVVATVNRETKQVSLLSIPRDLWVYIPTYGWGRINTAHRVGARTKYPDGKGPGLLMRTIEENLGIPIDHWVRISYDGFVGVVDELGGVDLVVPCATNLRYRPPTSATEQEIILTPGVHHLDGTTALRYVRTRRGDSDFERSGRQQQFLKAVWDQMKAQGLELIPKIPALWSAMKDNFQTDLDLGDVLALAPIALDLKPERIRSRYIGRGQVENWTTPEGASVLLPIPEKIEELVASLYAPQAARGGGLEHEGARIQVWNGTQQPQLDLIAADLLHWEGLQISGTGLADRADYAATRILVFNDMPEALEMLTRLLNVRPENIVQQPDGGQSIDIRVILGADYDPCR